MKKLIKTMATVTAAVLALSFVVCSCDGLTAGEGAAKASIDGKDVDKYAEGLGVDSSNGGGGNDDEDEDAPSIDWGDDYPWG